MARMPDQTPESSEERRRRLTRERVRRYRERQKETEVAAEEGDAQIAPADLELIERYLQLRATRLLAGSMQAYRTDLRQFATILGCSGLLGAESDDVASWIATRVRDPKDPDDPRPWSRRTARRKLSSLSGFYTWARRESLIERDPTENIELAPYYRPRPYRMDEQDLDILFDHLDFRIEVSLEEPERRAMYVLDRAMFRFCYNLALRVTEACDARFSRLEKSAGESQLTVVRKRDRIDVYPLTGIVRTSLESWLSVRRGLGVVRGHDDFIFLHPRHGRRVSRQRCSSRLKRAAREAGLDDAVVDNLSIHKLRHARAYHLIERGWSLPSVQALLGHTTISATNEYVRSDEKARLEAIRRSSKAESRRL